MAAALPGSRLCYFHDPAKSQQRADARRRGGQARSKPAAVLPAVAGDARLESVADVVALLGQTINQVRTGALDVKAANAVGYLASVLLRALEGGELARQLDQLRADVERLKHGDGNDAARGGPASGAAAGAGGGDQPAPGQAQSRPGPAPDAGGHGA
jgi:hypothetical protein